ncbi:unnamed protein product [Cylicocyclus nassatus]|uniref:Reverse transcriptase domain-containing protein n=1 Tax=Cylicocyclus nassatus TaxID=53992 RepID=A0AA36H389_CYLNA|nr:unnamed protein product [Cylicocyclus nassatus]
MSRILSGLEENYLACFDDIAVFDKDFPSHLNSLRKVFFQLRDINIKVSAASSDMDIERGSSLLSETIEGADPQSIALTQLTLGSDSLGKATQSLAPLPNTITPDHSQPPHSPIVGSVPDPKLDDSTKIG